MWELNNRTPFAAERIAVIDKNGERHWVVVVKGTFDILPNGRLKLSDKQVEPKFAPEYNGIDGESSLLYEQDLIASKVRTDVYVNGHAYAPDGRPCTEVPVGLKTPLGNKTLVVRGDRLWERNIVGLIKPSQPRPFVKMPVVYERAYGGYDKQDADPSAHRMYDRNPIGAGFFTKRSHRLGHRLPNIEFPGKAMDAGPAGFGAICSFWQPRRSYQGTYDAKWIEKRRPLLAVDYDPQALQCALNDQQIGPHLRGGEPIGLFNLTPTGTLTFTIPKHYFTFTTLIGMRSLEHWAAINTVIIEPEYPRVIVVWHSTLSCHHDIDDIDFTIIREKRYVQ
ncbi:MAG: DUF2169 domain-containing protein [candidate division Zixibacteria bacterium]|nr:DUF2169 domain-containing protein [candidate division Zixibacteria bacterium]